MEKIKFRQHRAGFDESMKTTKEFNNEKELIDYIQSIWDENLHKIIDIEYKYIGNDARNNWETTQILAYFTEDAEHFIPHQFVVGFTTLKKVRKIK